MNFIQKLSSYCRSFDKSEACSNYLTWGYPYWGEVKPYIIFHLQENGEIVGYSRYGYSRYNLSTENISNISGIKTYQEIECIFANILILIMHPLLTK